MRIDGYESNGKKWFSIAAMCEVVEAVNRQQTLLKKIEALKAELQSCNELLQRAAEMGVIASPNYPEQLGLDLERLAKNG